MKRIASWLTVFLVGFSLIVRAHEGMWIPILLDIDNMQRHGLKLSAEDIFSVNQASLKDAIVHFGGGCTAEVISEKGLILTNHHCGYGAVQRLSSVENDYLKDGFWAMDHSGELPCAGLTASFVDRIEDVTDEVLEGITDETDIAERNLMIAMRSAQIAARSTDGPAYSAEVKSFFHGNQYILIVKKTFNDVRLVGTPPSSIGKFGGDTDNWVWPRHTGDFAMFRIYANADNQPADYAAGNKPYAPAHSLPVSMKGVKEGDFTMVYGFPGLTEQYMMSTGVEYVTEVVNPIRIDMRENSLRVIDAAMASSDALRIQYAARQSRISNAWKKWIGQNMGLERFNALEKKRNFERSFSEKAASSQNEYYKAVMSVLHELHTEMRPYQLARDLFIEVVFYGPQIIDFSRKLDGLFATIEEGAEPDVIESEREKAVRAAKRYFKDSDQRVERDVFEVIIQRYLAAIDPGLQPEKVKEIRTRHGGNVSAYADRLYAKSILANEEALMKLLELGSPKKILKIKNDEAYLLGQSFFVGFNEQIRPQYDAMRAVLEEAMRIYVKAQMEFFPDRTFWSDANSTLRVTYGKVEGCIPQDGMAYLPHTTIEGVMHKYKPGDVEFDLPERLIRLYEEKDFGPYATDGTLNVAFLASNHTTGGNSGSPVINANGELIGLNFDRSWESTMSDIMFNPDICRNISVDVRYILFVVDKFAGASWLIDEMKLVHN